MGEQKLGSASLRGEGHMTAKGEVVFGWDDFSLLLLSVTLGGFVPLAVTSGIAVGAITENVYIGVGTGLGMLGVSFLLLFALTCPPVRQRLIPFARWLLKRR